MQITWGGDVLLAKSAGWAKVMMEEAKLEAIFNAESRGKGLLDVPLRKTQGRSTFNYHAQKWTRTGSTELTVLELSTTQKHV